MSKYDAETTKLNKIRYEMVSKGCIWWLFEMEGRAAGSSDELVAQLIDSQIIQTQHYYIVKETENCVKENYSEMLIVYL